MNISKNRVAHFFNDVSNIETCLSNNKNLNFKTFNLLKKLGCALTLSMSITPVFADSISSQIHSQSQDLLNSVVASHQMTSFVSPEIHLVEKFNEENEKSDAYFDKNNQCKVEITYTNKGQFSDIAQSIETIAISQTQNDTQTRMLREFELLHEEMHCQFVNIHNPIRPLNFSEKQINDINEVFNTMPQYVNNPVLWENLSESFADTAALAALMIKYEYDPVTQNYQKNDDFEKIKNIIILGRTDEYFSLAGNETNEHFTHFALEELQKPENLNRLLKSQQAQTVKSFQDLIIDIVNRGAEKLMVSRPISLNKMVSIENFNNCVVLNIFKILQEKDKTDYSDNRSLYNQKDKTGKSYTLAKEFIKRTHLEKANLYDEKGLIKNKQEFSKQLKLVVNTLPVYENITSIKSQLSDVVTVINNYQDYLLQTPTIKNERVEINMSAAQTIIKMNEIRANYLATDDSKSYKLANK